MYVGERDGETAGGVEPRPYTPNIEPRNSAFRSKSGSGKRSRDNATFRRNLLGTAFAWQMRSRYAAGEGAQRDFQAAGLNGVFGYFCRRGQGCPAPGRGISLWTIRREGVPRLWARRADVGIRPYGRATRVRRVNVSPSGASRHLSHRGRRDGGYDNPSVNASR